MADEIEITCHFDAPKILTRAPFWRDGFTPGDGPPEQRYCQKRHYGPFQTFRTCSYCGSMHPEDLLTALRAGAALGGSDWKYGWPHKFYVQQIPNPYPDLPIVTSHGGGGDTWTCGEPHPAGPTLSGKWYNEHLHDIRGTALCTDLCALITERTGIRFAFSDEGRLRYAAALHGSLPVQP